MLVLGFPLERITTTAAAQSMMAAIATTMLPGYAPPANNPAANGGGGGCIVWSRSDANLWLIALVLLATAALRRRRHA